MRQSDSILVRMGTVVSAAAETYDRDRWHTLSGAVRHLIRNKTGH